MRILGECLKCGCVTTAENLYPSRVRSKSYGVCIPCEKKKALRNYKIDRVRQTELKSKYRQDRLKEDPKLYRLKVMLNSAKTRSSKQGLRCDISLEHLKEVCPEECPVFGVKFVWTGYKKGTSKMAPSLDRIIPELGYVTGNVQVISKLANMMKSCATPEQLGRFAEWINKE